MAELTAREGENLISQAEHARRAWYAHDAGALVANSPRLVVRLPGADPSGALGQEAVNVAKAFHDALGLTGLILTKLDGDARGGAALSMRAVTNKPIKLIVTFAPGGQATGWNAPDTLPWFEQALRRAAALRLVQMSAGGSLAEAAAFLGIDEKTCRDWWSGKRNPTGCFVAAVVARDPAAMTILGRTA